MQIKINPLVISKIGEQEVTSSLLEINEVEVMLNKNANVSFVLRGDDNEALHNGQIYLTEDEYNGWGSDDNYVVDLVLSKLGAVQA